ncbi:DegT/DnrJ/EryC1/StrS family aminotransferase [Candidatus Avoscillospira sp. LCP25S3_F1]|uniref:DegT/DnrJ/EryC1/StrS family aminotransferase n=1 Tax=Candidatus Avoscillospira sp. LCP25S3_F1 TaxID=3438825 RepID=UPI003F90CD61
MNQIPFSPPDITEKEIAEVVDTLRSGWITTGPKTKRFEREIAAFCGNSYAVCLNSATASMELTLRLFGIGPGDEVIVPAYTYTATASVVAHVGATIVMVDCADNSYEMDYEKMARAITSRTKAIIPVDLGGILCDYEQVYRIVLDKKSVYQPSNALQEVLGRILVLADASHSFGAEAGQRRSGNFADFSAFSFHAVKNLTTAEGGAVTWRDDLGLDGNTIYRQYMLMSLHGQSKDALAKTQLGAWEYDIVAPLYKCNMTDIMAAIGLAQLHRYGSMLETRRSLVSQYNAMLHGACVQPAHHLRPDNTSSCHLYLTQLQGKTLGERNAVIEKLAEQGISTNVHYKPLPLLTAYRNMGFRMEDYPKAYARYETELTLPLYSTLTMEQVERICREIRTMVR